MWNFYEKKIKSFFNTKDNITIKEDMSNATDTIYLTWNKYMYLHIISKNNLTYFLDKKNWHRKLWENDLFVLCYYYYCHFLCVICTGWSIWYCPILDHYCHIFSLISKQVFLVLSIRNFGPFCFMKSDFWYSRI